MNRKVVRFGPENKSDFFTIHNTGNKAGWCFCSAWWTPTWEGWAERTAAENLDLRRSLLANGEYDGYILYVDEAAVGWCQVGKRDRLKKLTKQFELKPNSEAWAITCFLIAPNFRRAGLAQFLLSEVLVDLPRRGAKRVEVFPRRGRALDDLDMWNGPEPMFVEAGFQRIKEDPVRIVMAMDLNSSD